MGVFFSTPPCRYLPAMAWLFGQLKFGKQQPFDGIPSFVFYKANSEKTTSTT